MEIAVSAVCKFELDVVFWCFVDCSGKLIDDHSAFFVYFVYFVFLFCLTMMMTTIGGTRGKDRQDSDITDLDTTGNNYYAMDSKDDDDDDDDNLNDRNNYNNNNNNNNNNIDEAEMDKNFNDSLLGGNSNESYIIDIDNHNASNNSNISFKTNFDNNYNDNNNDNNNNNDINDYNNDRNVSIDENASAGPDAEAAALDAIEPFPDNSLYAKSIKINKSVKSSLHLQDKIKIYQLSRTINIDEENDSMNVNVSSNNLINVRNSKSKSKSRSGDGRDGSHNKTIEFCDYAPHVFRYLRQSIYNVTDREYLESIEPCFNEHGYQGEIMSKFSEGRSGSFFFYTYDQKYLIKTISARDAQTLLDILKNYVDYLKSNTHPTEINIKSKPKSKSRSKGKSKTKAKGGAGGGRGRDKSNSQLGMNKTIRFVKYSNLGYRDNERINGYDIENRMFKCESYLDRFFGLHSIKLYNLTIYFVVTKYIFVRNCEPSEKYDIKGSWIDRHTNHHVDRGKQMKDEDLHKKLLLEPMMANNMYQQLRDDAQFLQSENIMDYSLLVGIYYVRMHNKHSKQHSKYHTRLSRLSRQSGMPSEDYTYGIYGDDVTSNFDSTLASSFIADNDPLHTGSSYIQYIVLSFVLLCIQIIYLSDNAMTTFDYFFIFTKHQKLTFVQLLDEMCQLQLFLV